MSDKKPSSVAFIPDGNRRFGEKNGLGAREAYNRGFEKAREVVNWCLQEPIKVVTLYALSLDNYRKRFLERQVLLPLFQSNLETLADSDEVHDNRVRVEVIGRRDVLPSSLRKSIEDVEGKTEGYGDRRLNIALCYDGRQEIVDAVSQLLASKEAPSVESLSRKLYTESCPDLVVRTGKYRRLSGFLLWQSSYSELFFSEKLWPEFSRREFDKALDYYSQVKRNFGK